MSFPEAAKVNIKAGLNRLAAKKDGTAVHYCIVRVAGAKGSPRVVFGDRASKATTDTFKVVWAKDPEVKPKEAGNWFVARGVVVVEGDDMTVHPANKGNKVVDPTGTKAQFRDLKKSLVSEGLQGAALDPVIAGVVGVAIDTTKFVDAKAEPEEEGRVEAEEEEDGNDLAFEADANVKSDDVKTLIQRFGAMKLRDARKLRVWAADDGEKRNQASSALGTFRSKLREIESDATDLQKRLRNATLGETRYADSLRALDELLARVRSEVTWIEADLVALTAAGHDVHALAALKDSDGVGGKAQEWLEEAANLAKKADVWKRELDQPGNLEALGRALHGSDLAAKARAEKRVKGMRKDITRLGVIAKSMASDVNAYRPQYTEAHTAFNKLIPVAQGLVEALEKHLDAASADALWRQADAGKTQRTNVRTTLTSQLTERPGIVEAFAAKKGGPEHLDAMVGDLGGKLTGAQDKAFVKAALKARFKCDVSGDLTSKALPRLYQVLRMVPESHTFGNDSLSSIIRNKVTDTDPTTGNLKRATGDYGSGTATVNVGRTGFGAHKSPWDLGSGGKAKRFAALDHVTLHEIGHSVDAKLGFMAGKRDDDKFAGWHEETPASVASALGAAFGFLGGDLLGSGDEGLPRAKRLELLERVLENKDDAALEIAKAHLRSKSADEGGAGDVMKHAAVKACMAARIEGENKGLWKTGDGFKAAMDKDGRVYQEAYASKWWSYDSKARTRKVSDYQFRAPQEWFAEIYAAYYLGSLDDEGQDHAWMEKDVDK